MEDFADDVPLLLDALRIDRAGIVGHSGSCLVARRVAIDHPERRRGLGGHGCAGVVCAQLGRGGRFLIRGDPDRPGPAFGVDSVWTSLTVYPRTWGRVAPDTRRLTRVPE